MLLFKIKSRKDPYQQINFSSPKMGFSLQLKGLVQQGSISTLVIVEKIAIFWFFFKFHNFTEITHSTYDIILKLQ